jgi:hypothetical protein
LLDAPGQSAASLRRSGPQRQRALPWRGRFPHLFARKKHRGKIRLVRCAGPLSAVLTMEMEGSAPTSSLIFFGGRLIPLSPVVKLPKPARLWAAVAPKVASSPRPGWVWSALPAGSIGGATQARGLAACIFANCCLKGSKKTHS